MVCFCRCIAILLLFIAGLTPLESAQAQSARQERKPVAFVRRLILIDSATNGPISDLRDGMSIRLADVPEGRLNILAETYPRRVDSVSFKLIEQSISKSDAEAPFTLVSSGSGAGTWRPRPGNLTVIVQPTQQGAPGIPLRMKITFIGEKPIPESAELAPVKQEIAQPQPEKLTAVATPPPESRARLAPPQLPPPDLSAVRPQPPELSDEQVSVDTMVEEPLSPEPSDRCRAVRRAESGQLTVVCAHSLTNAAEAQLMLRAQIPEGNGAGAVVSSEPLCEFENAVSPIVTSCVFVENQLERLQVRIRTAEGRERIIPVGFD